MHDETYPKALIPDFLREKMVKTMPIETPYYINPDNEDDDFFSDPPFCVTADGVLNCRRSAPLDRTTAEPHSILGRIGIMKVVINKDEILHEAFIADLRFIRPGVLVTIDEAIPDDQEEFNDWVSTRADLVAIEAFIAPSDTHPEGATFSGDERYYDALQLLREQSDTVFNHTEKQNKKKQLKNTTAEKKNKFDKAKLEDN
jgi:hypothetical protein